MKANSQKQRYLAVRYNIVLYRRHSQPHGHRKLMPEQPHLLLYYIVVLYCHVTKAMLVPDFALHHHEVA